MNKGSRGIACIFTLPILLITSCATAFAQVQVSDPWVRATVIAQKTSGAYMRLESKQDARLLSARTPVAGIVELHSMEMVDNVMRMRAVSGIDVPAGKGAELKPGGFHMMLMELKRQLREGDTVPITLVVEGKDKKRQTIEVQATVRPLQATGAHGNAHSGAMKH